MLVRLIEQENPHISSISITGFISVVCVQEQGPRGRKPSSYCCGLPTIKQPKWSPRLIPAVLYCASLELGLVGRHR